MLKFFSVNQSSFQPVAGGVAKTVYSTPLVALLTDSGVAHNTLLEGWTPVSPYGRRHSHALRLPVLKAIELPISRACAARGRRT